MENSREKVPPNATPDSAHNPVVPTTATEQEKLACEIEKLRAETESLRSSNRWENRVTRYAPIVTVLIAVASFWFGIYQFTRQQRAENEKLRGQFEDSIKLSEKEFRRRFYEKQLDVYFDVSKTVAQIATVGDSHEVDRLHTHFLELYNGSLIMVQDSDVRDAAETFEESFNEYRNKRSGRDKVQDSARDLVRACRNSLLTIWDIKSLDADNGDQDKRQ
jgi:hypothetical protein